MKEGWEIKKLVEVCEIVNGGTPDTKIKEFWDGDNLWITPKDMGKLNSIFEGLKNSSAKLLPENSVILSSRAPIGHLAINNHPISTNQGCKGLIPKTDLNTLFLYYFLKNSVKLLNDLGSGTTFKELSGSKLGTIEIPLPPLPEQQRIVQLLDEAFEKIETLKANAEHNLQNAKELFQSALTEELKPKEGWEERKLNEITTVKDGTHDSPRYIENGIPFVTQKNIKQDGLTLSDTKFITETDHEKFYKRSDVTYGDILISMIGANRGMAAIVDDKRVFSIKNVGLIKASESINQNFLLFFLKSSIAMNYVLEMSNGGAQEFIGLTALRSFPIPLPTLPEQQTIVEHLDALSARCKTLETNYQKTIAQCDEMKKAVLAKAFNGEL